MSRSAGRVLIIPKGEYSATTQYYMLDLVEYNGCGYVAKQATKGNVPTNETYWQQMGTTGGGGDPSTYMLKDGSNAEILNFSNATQTLEISGVSITKSAGDNQTVYMQVSVAYNSTTGKLTDLIEGILNAHVGDEGVYFYGVDTLGNAKKIYVVIDGGTGSSRSYDTDPDTINLYGHLVEDVSTAIEYTNKSLNLGGYINDTQVDRGIVFGYGSTLANNLGFAGGLKSSSNGLGFAFGDQCYAGNRGHAEGKMTSANGTASHAEGQYTSADGTASHAEGTGTLATDANQHAMGKWNLPHYDALFMVGYGSDGANRSNVFEIYNDGSISFDNGTTKYKFARVGGVNGYYDKGGTFHPMESTVLTRNNVQLSTTDPTNISMNSSAIKSTSRIQVFTNKFGIDPSDVEVNQNGNWVYLTFDPVESAITIDIQVLVD